MSAPKDSISIVDEDIFRYIELDPDKRQESLNELISLKCCTWKGVTDQKEFYPVCQMCFNPTVKGEELCARCFYKIVAPVSPFDPCVCFWSRRKTYNWDICYPWDRQKCNECASPCGKGEMVVMYCCKASVCLQCYIDELEEPEPRCPSCTDHPLMVSLWAIDYYYLMRRERPGITQLYNSTSRMKIASMIYEDEDVNQNMFNWDSAKWCVDKFTNFRTWMSRENPHLVNGHFGKL